MEMTRDSVEYHGHTAAAQRPSDTPNATDGAHTRMPETAGDHR